ncbi:MAG: peroxiredoxin family protein [Steroidobacteraceae bacterium]
MLAVPISQAKESAVWVPPGPTVGSVFPDALSLQDQTGKQQNLKALLGKNGAAVFFVRSADWCPFCMRQLVDANSKLDEFRQLGLNVVSVSIDTPDKLASFHQKQAIGYTMLSDPDGVIVEKLGIRDPQYAQGSMAYGVARPMIFIVNPQLKITHKFAEESYRNRPDLTKVLAELNKK